MQNFGKPKSGVGADGVRVKFPIRVGMNGDTFSIKAPKECSKKFAATFQGKFLTRVNVLRIFFLFLEDFAVPL